MTQALSANSQVSHYRILSKLGAGGMGEVWLAEDTRLGRKVALKLLPAEFTEDSDRVRRFTQEAKAASALNHPNIISVFDIGECVSGRFIVMEFVSGRTLRHTIANENSVESLFTFGPQMARALSTAHAAGITHRDIKPDNIMVRDDGYVKMLDFGLARLLPTTSSDPEDATLAQTTPGTVIGTLAYMSPEQASGLNVSAPSDVFSLGVVFYELATGRHPFKSDTMIGYLNAITSQTPASLTSVKPGLSPALDELILRMLEKDAVDRPTANEVAQALIDIERHGTTSALPPRTLIKKPNVTQSTQDEGFWVAVLPFKYRGANGDLESLAEGISEDIITGLSRFSSLRVIARGSTLRYTSEIADVRSIGKELGARYVMEGSLRQAGSALRLVVQLVDASNGAHLWAETYDRQANADDIFALQDELVPRIVSTIADWYGVLTHSMSEAVRLKPLDQLTPYEALLRSFGYYERVSLEEHEAARTGLERAVEQAPGNADLWAMLSMIYGEEHRFEFNVLPDPLGRSLEAAKRAVSIAPSNHFAHLAHAQALFFRKEFDGFRHAAERSISLNPMDGSTLEYLAHLICFSGDWEYGVELAEKSRGLNPNHPAWYWAVPFYNAFRKGDYVGARAIAAKVEMPNDLCWAMNAAVFGHLGEPELSERALRKLLALSPDFAKTGRNRLEKWYLPELVEPLIDGLCKAGLDMVGASTTPSLQLTSSDSRSDEGFWVAVLPFKYRGSNTDLEALAEGLTEDIIAGLSRFSALRVIARGSTLRFTSESADLRSIGKQLGARYVMEGSLRQVGSMLRLVVQLIDATTGAHLWAETYDRPVDKEKFFVLHDDLVPRIVSSVADWYGALTHSMSEAVFLKPIDQLTTYEAVLRGFGYYERVTLEDHGVVRARLERAVEESSGNADAWAMLSMMYGEEYRFKFNERPESMKRALDAARRAVDLAPSNHFAYLALAQALYFNKDFDAFRNAAERTIALNPMDGSTMEYIGHLLAFSGDWEYGCGIADRARDLNPNHPVWYWALPFLNAYRNGNYAEARSYAIKFFSPGFYLTHVMQAAVYGKLGEHEAGAKAIRDLLAILPDAAVVREQLEKWYQPELVETLMDGLRKAGLEQDGRTSIARSSHFISSEFRSDEGFWVAVLPFKFTPQLETLAEGLSEEIVTGLSRFSYLRVISRSSTLRYATETSDVRTVGKTLGARYVIEGSLRLAGSLLRASVQLVDATTGAHLWVESYKRPFSSEAIFDLQDDLAARIVSTVADMNGVLTHTMGEMLRQRNANELTPYEAVLRSLAYISRLNVEEHKELRTALERSVVEAPDQADCWAMLSDIYADEFRQGFNVQPNSLERALAAAQRAVGLAPTNQLAYYALASALFFRRDLQAFRTAAERAVALNPMESVTTAFMGILIAYSGDWDYGCALVEKGMDLNPNHPGWFRFTAFFREFSKGDYRAALDVALKMNMPSYFFTHAALAAAYGKLGDLEKAQVALRELLIQQPDFGAIARESYEKWFGPGELLEDVLDGLIKAGLKIETKAASPQDRSFVSGEERSERGLWIAVLPFKYTGSDTEIATLADGLSEEIVTGLSRFSYLRVIARSSTLRFRNDNSDVRTIGRTLGARYVMEGSLRFAGSLLRISVQLVDASTGAHLWAQTYDRPFRSEDIFNLQDELVPLIVSTIADISGVLPRSMSEAVRTRDREQLTPYEAVLLSFSYFEHVSPDALNEARSCIELAVQKAPDYADAWAMLAFLCVQDHAQGFDLQPDSLSNGTSAAQRAVGLSPSNHLAHYSLAQALFFQKDLPSFRNEAERVIALNPMDGNSIAFIGELLIHAGYFERGLELATRAKKLNPNHPGWYWNAEYFYAFQQGDYRAAVDFLLKSNLSNHWGTHAAIAAALGQLGEVEAAAKALKELLRVRPNAATTISGVMKKWVDADSHERFIDGLRKAGLPNITDAEEQRSNLSSETRTDEGFWIAVLPFKAIGTNNELQTLASGLTEGIVTGLSRFSYLRVIARASTLRFTNETSGGSAGKSLGARYVMEGSVRQSGSTIRVGVQLVDTTTGAHLWAEAYDRPFLTEDIFPLQDDLVPRIVSTVADQHGVLPHSMSESVRRRDPEQLTPYESVLRYFRYCEGVTEAEHAVLRAALERAVKEAPSNADCWAMLAIMYCDEYKFGFNQMPDSLGRALTAAQRAVEISPTNPFAYEALSQALFFRKEFGSFRNAAERAISLNPVDGATTAFMGMLIAFTGDWDEGCAIAERATELNPHHPGWYSLATFYNAYRKHDYDDALKATLKFNMPSLFYTHSNLAAVYAQLGDSEAASKSLSDLLSLKPDFASTARYELNKWLQPEFVEHLIDGYRKAGLAIDEADTSSPTSSSALSSEIRADDGFWVAVLPFKATGSDPELAILAEGLSDEIITGLNRFSYLRVIARSSTLRYATQTSDVRTVGKSLGARYVMEGSLRQAGAKVRIAVQLVDATTGADLWAENYERSFNAECLFELQDDLVPRIVSTVADLHGVLPRSLSDAVQNRPVEELSPYEAVLRSFGFAEKITPEALYDALSALEMAVKKAPTYSDAWAMLGSICSQDYAQGFNLQPDSLTRGEVAARKAVELAPQNHLAWYALANVHFFQKELQSFQNAAERAVALNPMDGNSLANLGELLVFIGESERGLELVEQAKRLNPHHPGWYWYANFYDAYRQHDYRAALNFALKVSLPGHWAAHLLIAAASGQLGEIETGKKAVAAVLKLRPDIGSIVRKEFEKWWSAEDVEHLIEGLRKSGLKS